MMLQDKIAFLMRSSTLPTLFLTILAGCAPHECQEDLYLEVDGSGEVMVSCSEEISTLLFGIDEETEIEDVELLLESPGQRVVSLKRSRRQGRGFLHLRVRFEDLNQLSHERLFQGGRRYRLETRDDLLELRVDIRDHFPHESEGLRDGLFRFRVHFPSPVRHHNSETGIERGNIITWEHTVVDHLDGQPLHVEARFQKQTVLAVTLTLLAISLSVVALVISAAFLILVRVGRRQLASNPDDPP